jgi:HK97 family phage prohead protease
MPVLSTEHRRVAGLSIETRFLNEEARSVDAAVSSVTPVDRGGYIEILDHRAEAIDLRRAAKGLSLIFGHDQFKPIGLADQFRTDGKTLRCRLTFGRSTAADEAWRDVSAGTLKHLSIGYQVHDARRDGDTVRVVKWEPFEISLVTVPADPTVGIGRSFSKDLKIMENTNSATTGTEMAAERGRISAIMALGRKHDMAAQAESAIREGVPLDAFRAEVLGSIAGKQQPMASVSWSDRENTEVRHFSLSRAIAAQLTNDWTNAGFEREVSQEIARRSGRTASGFFAPSLALSVDLH